MRPKKGWKVNKELKGRESRMRLKKDWKVKKELKGRESRMRQRSIEN
jgi:hypothetical protein